LSTLPPFPSFFSFQSLACYLFYHIKTKTETKKHNQKLVKIVTELGLAGDSFSE
jgi:hypothetical protein